MSQLLIYNNKVIQVEIKKFPVHKDLKWVSGIGKAGDSYIDGKIIPQVVEKEPTKTYLDHRAREYSMAFSLKDQIDIIAQQFMHMTNVGELTLLDETQDWINTRNQIKDNNPKPNEN